MVVLTVGKTYIDIDGYASCIAYRELLHMLGVEAKFVSHAVLNYSITKSLLSLPYKIDDYCVDNTDQFIIVDFSNIDFFPDFLDEDRIIEVIDHHFGYEQYWHDKLGDMAVIEPIGAVATVVVEKYESNKMLDKIDKEVAKLLMSAILDNTLHFTANITSDRDKIAYEKLQKITGESDYDNTYYSECQKSIESNLRDSIVNDLKRIGDNKYLPVFFGQLTIWDIVGILDKIDEIKKIMFELGSKWMLNIICLKDNVSNILCSDDEVRNNIKELLGGSINGEFVVVMPAKLRKEILNIAKV